MGDREPGRGQTSPATAYRRLLYFEDIQEDLRPIEDLAREINDLTAILHGTLTDEQFRLVWSLRDNVERLALAEELLRERTLAAGIVPPPEAV